MIDLVLAYKWETFWIVALAFLGWAIYEEYIKYKTKKFDEESKMANALLQKGLSYNGSRWLRPVRYSDLVKYSEEHYDQVPYWYDHSKALRKKGDGE